MSKSSPSTSTTTTTNPIAQAQLPYLQGLWGTAAGYAGGPGGGSNPVLGQSFLDRQQIAASNNFNTAYGTADQLVPGANQFMLNAFAGSVPQANYASGPQIGALSGMGPNAMQNAFNMQALMTNAAGGIPGAIAGNVDALNQSGNAAMGILPQAQQWGNTLAGMGQQALSGLTGLGMQGVNALTGAGTGAANTLAGIGQQALQGLSGLGSNAIGAIGGLAPSAMAAGVPAEQGLNASAGMAIGGNPIYNSLMGMAGGQYVDPRTNPALAGTIQAATTPLVNQYQTAVAPGIDAGAEAAGRYGSGTLANQQTQAQYGLGQGLGSAISSIVNNAYNTGLSSMLGAGQALGSAYNTGIGNINNAFQGMGQLAQQGVQNAGNLLSNAYQTGGGLTQAGYNTMAQTGQAGQQDLINALNSAYGTGGGLVQGGYSTGGQLTGAGANAFQGIANTALQNANTAYSQGGNLQLGGQNAMLGALGQAGQIGNQGYQIGGGMLGQAGQLANAGQLGLAGIMQQAPDLANFPLSQATAGFNSAWAPIQNYGALLGGAQGTYGTSSTTTPYYQNIPQSIVSGLQGVSSIGSLMGGLGSAFSWI